MRAMSFLRHVRLERRLLPVAGGSRGANNSLRLPSIAAARATIHRGVVLAGRHRAAIGSRGSPRAAGADHCFSSWFGFSGAKCELISSRLLLC